MVGSKATKPPHLRCYLRQILRFVEVRAGSASEKRVMEYGLLWITKNGGKKVST